MSTSLPYDSLSAYLRQQNRLHPYDVRPRLELIMDEAVQLAAQKGDHLTALYIAWAMLRVEGSIARDLLQSHGLKESHVQEACELPSLHQMDLRRFYDRIVDTALVRRSKLMGTEHLLMALLTDRLLCAQFTVWGIDVSSLQEATHNATVAMNPAAWDENSLSSYLLEQNCLAEFDVRPRVERVMSEAGRLAAEKKDHLNALYIAWAMLRVSGSAARDLLTRFGLTEAQIQAACEVPSFYQMDVRRLYAKLLNNTQVQKARLMGTEHLLMVLLTDEFLSARLSAWGLDVTALQDETLRLART
jgi:hypothetical protein